MNLKRNFYIGLSILMGAVVVFSSGCEALPEIDKTVSTVSKLSQIDIYDFNTGGNTIVNFEYVQYDKEMNMSELDTGVVNSFAPVIRRQKIEGDTLKMIQYTFTADNGMNVEIESITGKREMLFKLNSKKIADSLYNGSGYDFYRRIQCDKEGMRVQVEDSLLVVKNSDYVSATFEDRECIRFEYPDSAAIASGNVVHNVIGIQQVDMPGEGYMWVTGAFGKQSKRFYTKKIVTREDGKIDEYVHNYVVDNLKLLVEDHITKDGKDYKIVKYSYIEYQYRK